MKAEAAQATSAEPHAWLSLRDCVTITVPKFAHQNHDKIYQRPDADTP